MGIPLKLRADITSPTTRSTLEETYQQIISDFRQAADLLPVQVSVKTRPSKAEFVDTFPGDESGNTRPRQTPGVLYSKAVPTPVQKPELLA